MRVLVVGAGAVGQVYGRHLAQAGAEVSFLVKPKYADAARRGFPMACLNHGAEIQQFSDFAVLTGLDEVSGQRWDQLWLCISSPALRGDWLRPTIEATGDSAVISFQPGLRDRELLAPLVPTTRLTKGLIAFSSWHAPLPKKTESKKGGPGGADATPHTAYWSPPLSPSQFQGQAAESCASTLVRGGLPAKVGSALSATAKGSSFLLPCVAAMECAGWTFSGLRQPRWARLASRAAAQALAISCAHLEISKGSAGFLMNPLAIRLGSRAAVAVAPFDIETFFAIHFSKVGEQTVLALDTWLAEGEQRGLPTDALAELRGELLLARGQASG